MATAVSVSLQLENGAFKVIGWQIAAEPPAGWESIFTISTGTDALPMFGAYSVENGTLTFRPRFPLVSGVTYHAVFHPTLAVPVEASFPGPPAAFTSGAPATRVLAIYPSAAVLPSNQLKLYVVFSAPMRNGGIWPKIHLVDQDGAPAVLPFVELDQELWNRDFTRLTLLFDPGRIKRGVKPNLDMGPVLVEGKGYTLVIDRELKDGNSLPLAETFRHEFLAGPAERRGVDPKQWKIVEPRQGTTDPLVIDFDRPLDYALLGDVFEVLGVSGSASIGPDEAHWSFQPTQPWKPGDHTLIIDMALEDLAGNRIGRPFDVDTFARPAERISSQKTTVTFRVQ